MMTTLHRKPRGASELSASAGGGGTSSTTSYYTTIDILPSSSARDATSVHSTNGDSHQSSKTRRHGGSKYVRRSGFFGRGNGSPSSSTSSSASSTASKKMSTTQLRAFFAACVLVYLSALCFAEDIVKFGKAVNSDATRQKIFSQWRPMHSAAKQVLRSIVDTANGNSDGAAVVVANVTEPLPKPETALEKQEEKSGSPEPSMNSEREPPTAAVLTAAPPAEEQVAPISDEPHAALLQQELSFEPAAEANQSAVMQKRSDLAPQVQEVNDKHPHRDAVPVAVESPEVVPQHIEAVLADNDGFDPAQMEDRMEDSVVVDEHQSTMKPSESQPAGQDKDTEPEQQHRPSTTLVVPSFPNVDDDAEKEHNLPESTQVTASPAEATVAVTQQPAAALAEEKDPVSAAAAKPVSPLVIESHEDVAQTQEPALQAPAEESLAKAADEIAKTEETTPESRHPGREET